MYSAVLMAALVSGTATPDFCFRGGCYGGYSGYGYGCGGCYGCGYGCGGCYGCSSCWGGAYTFGGYGFAGGGYGYHGGCYGGYGNAYGAPYTGCTGCYGCYGGYSGYGVPVPMPEMSGIPFTPGVDKTPPINPPKMDDKAKGPEEVPLIKEKKIVVPPPDKKPGTNEQARAQVRIEIPVGGKLYVDGRWIDVPAGPRTFRTPPLAQGQKFFYDIRIEIERDGQVVSDQRRVIIESGQSLAVAFPALVAPGTSTVRANE